MAKRFVRISLATKFRLLFGTAALGIIAAALVVPWYFLEQLGEQMVQRPADELTLLRLKEWQLDHQKDPDAPSKVKELYAMGAEGELRKGPTFITLPTNVAPDKLDAPGRSALKAFLRNPEQQIAIIPSEAEAGQALYRCFRTVRMQRTCVECHRTKSPKLQFHTGQLVGMIDVTIPADGTSGSLVVWTQGAFVVGGVLAAILALVLFAVITQRLILRPVRSLRDVADRAAEGDLAARSTIRTGDELERLGESFNEMLDAIAAQHEKLRAANRALDLKLHELAEANVTLFQANKVKTEFLANISHELRTPLNSIIGFADLVADGEGERTRRYGQNIGSAARDLLKMINDLLDLAKIEAGKAQIRPDKVSVTDTCQTLVSLMKPLADKKQIRLDARLVPDLPIAITDAGKLQQILYNLLSNAIKFTPAGGAVTVATRREDTARNGNGGGAVAISVADTGPGIAEADQQRIFEKFYQLDRALTKESAGAGLGLAIARELANLLGGMLTLRSEPGHGAEFTLHLPIDAGRDS